jgi:hypothetical protein
MFHCSSRSKYLFTGASIAVLVISKYYMQQIFRGSQTQSGMLPEWAVLVLACLQYSAGI